METIELKVGESQDFKYHTLYSAGYLDRVVNSDLKVVGVSIHEDPNFKLEPGFCGSSAPKILTVIGLSPGTSKVLVEHYRPWNEEKHAVAEYRINVAKTHNNGSAKSALTRLSESLPLARQRKSAVEWLSKLEKVQK